MCGRRSEWQPIPMMRDSAHDVIRQADGMMYMVKNSTRDNIGIAQRGMLQE